MKELILVFLSVWNTFIIVQLPINYDNFLCGNLCVPLSLYIRKYYTNTIKIIAYIFGN